MIRRMMIRSAFVQMLIMNTKLNVPLKDFLPLQITVSEETISSC